MNTKKDGVCNYLKNSLSLNVLDKACNFIISLYRSPSRSKDEFESFADNLEQCLELNVDSVALRNPYLSAALGDFNTQTKRWYPLSKTTYEGTRIDDITSQFRLEQLIHESTNIIGGRSPCIDSIFASQPNLVVESGVQSVLYQNCHHQIVFANVDHIREAINGFHWKIHFKI